MSGTRGSPRAASRAGSVDDNVYISRDKDVDEVEDYKTANRDKDKDEDDEDLAKGEHNNMDISVSLWVSEAKELAEQAGTQISDLVDQYIYKLCQFIHLDYKRRREQNSVYRRDGLIAGTKAFSDASKVRGNILQRLPRV